MARGDEAARGARRLSAGSSGGRTEAAQGLPILAAQGASASATTYLTAARAALALLEAGGSTNLERTIGHCRKARKLGAKAAETVEQKLTALRVARAQAPAPLAVTSVASADRIEIAAPSIEIAALLVARALAYVARTTLTNRPVNS